MQRLLYTDLVKWKDDPDRKPLIVKGVRQCGKTWLLNTFSQDCFEDAAYFNFEKSADLCTIFEKLINRGLLLQTEIYFSFLMHIKELDFLWMDVNLQP